MDFNNHNLTGRMRMDTNSFTNQTDIFNCLLDNDSMAFNKEDTDGSIDDADIGDYYKLQNSVSGRTYTANSRLILSGKVQGYSQSPGTCSFNHQDVAGDIQHVIDSVTGVYDSNHQLANNHYMPCSSKGLRAPKPFHKNISNETFNKIELNSVRADNFYTIKNDTQNKFTDKSTYCRPVSNYYNQQFILKTLAKNARLQRLVRQLMLVRQKQKEEDLWNNYINELKNRHGHCSELDDTSPTNPDDITPERIEDYYDTRFRSRQSDLCRNLLDDFYEVDNNYNHNEHFSPSKENCQPRDENCRQPVYGHQSYCYPTASQGRLMMLNKQIQGNQFHPEKQFSPENRPPFRYYRGNTICVEKEPVKHKKSQHVKKMKPTKSTNTIDCQNSKTSLINTAMQTELRCLYPINENEDDSRPGSAKERYQQVTKNVERLKRKLERSNADVKQDALNNIENKLNNLIQTLNTFMVDIRTHNPFIRDNKSLSLSSRVRINDLNELNAAKSDTLGVINREESICRAAHENFSATSGFFDYSTVNPAKNQYEKIDKILNEEMEKSKRLKKDIEDMMYRRTHCPRAVQIAIDIPTKERSTEVTQSLSKARVIEEIPRDEPTTAKINTDRRITMAVNTDPLGFLGLLRISSEAVKQILSYMPQIDYYSYLPILQFPQTRNGLQHFVCNICGASFRRPSQLSDHIQSHNLGYSRDCCVCRHVLDMKKRRPGLFKCKYCGQRFTRAYCCELHEETCAKRLGVQHEGNSSLTLLQ